MITSFLAKREEQLTEKLALHQTGEWGLLPANKIPTSTMKSVCGFCSTGCNLTIHLQGERVVHLTPTPSYPVNQGKACPKGLEALRVLQSDDRATHPLVKNGRGEQVPIGWEEAIQLFCNRFQSIQREHGKSSVAFLSSGQIPTEEMALLGCLAKMGMGILHGDGNTRQCMATSVVAYKESFGFDAPPYTYADFEESDLLVFVGANPCVAHPILWQRVLNNPHRPEILVVDPRTTETAMSATEHLALKPKSDLLLLYGIAAILLCRDAVDTEFIEKSTEGFAEFARFLGTLRLEVIEETTGISIDQLHRVTCKIAAAKRASFWWTMGVNQSYQGVRTAQAIINLALMTGNMGRPGTGANSITGQCNAMGSRLFSNTTNLFGHHDFGKKEHREKIATILGMPVEKIPTENSLAYDQILTGIEEGTIRGLWIIATNPSHSWIQSDRAKRLFAKLDFLVVQDMYHGTETAIQADLLLPAAAWGEKEGTFINSERRIGTIKRVARAPGEALADFSIFRLIAESWGCGEYFRRWTSPEAAFQLMKEASRGQPCDITGIEDYDHLDQCGGIQWPWTESDQRTNGNPDPERRLFEEGRFYHPSGKAKFLFAENTSMPELPCIDYPLLLLTGRGSVCQWHTETRTKKSSLLRGLSPKEPFVEMNPEDARRRSLVAGDQVLVTSRRGSIRLRCVVSANVQPGCVFIPMHDVQTNVLTLDHIDPYSRQPSYKDCAVQLIKAENAE